MKALNLSPRSVSTAIHTLLILLSLGMTIPVSAQLRAHKEASSTSEDTREKTDTPILLEELLKKQSGDYVITSQYTGRNSGIKHIYLRQAINGIEIYGTESSIHFDASGKKIVSHNRFVPDINENMINANAGIGAEQALTSVAQQMGYSLNDVQVLDRKNTLNQETLFNKAGISGTEIPAKLMYYYREGVGTTMVWELSVQELTSSDWWNFRVDAASGSIIDKDNWTVSCLEGVCEHFHGDLSDNCEATDIFEDVPFYTVPNEEESSAMVGSYRVYAMPVESPNHGGRTLEVNPDNSTASPYGWHDTNGSPGNEYTYTRGNNTRAYDDDNANNLPDGKYAYSGGSMVFDFPINTNYSAGNQSEDAAVTNLFYWSNIIHDVLYFYGFDEAAGNFQENNYGNGGLGSDSVNSEAQDGSGTCNANFGTPSDGGNPRMQMYVCNNRDGDLDNGVIIHEYGHGISNRLTGGPAASGCLGNQEQMGEGWSDYYGLMLTMEVGDTRTDSRGIGTWLVGQGANGPGIRTYPYSTNFAVNPHTYSDITTEAVPHGVGSVWCAMLWEMTWDLIDLYGFDPDFYNGTGGNNIAIELVTEAMALQPCSPGFVDGRDAILLADQNLNGGANQCLIWDAFARRGLGHSATQGSTNSRADGTEAFDLPPGTAAFNNTISEVCITEGAQIGLGGGTPTGGVYSGAGVTDDGNGTTYTFDPNVAGVGTATVTYTVLDGCTGSNVNLNETIEVTDGTPTIICQDITLTLDGTGSALLNPFANRATLVGGNNGSGSAGFSAIVLTPTQDATLTFDWNFSTTDSPQFDSFGYIQGNTYFALSTNSGNPQSGTFSIDLSAGVQFGLCTFTANNQGGPATGIVTNLSPGYIGQFAESNWTEIQQNSNGNAAIEQVNMLSVMDSCSSVTENLSQSIFTCLNIGDNEVTVEVTDDSNGLSETCTATVTVLPGAAGQTTFNGSTWNNGPPNWFTIANIDGNYDTGSDGDLEACACTISPGNTVTVRGGDYMDVDGNINVDGSLIVEHEGSVVQSYAFASVNKTGTINVELTTPVLQTRDFMVMGSPMDGETRDGVFNSAFLVLQHTPANFIPHPGVPAGGTNFADDNNDFWNQISGATPITVGEGYIVRPQSSYTDPANTTFDMTYTQGTLNTGTYNMPITYNGPGPNPDGTPNVLANPYASAIDADDLISNNALVNEVYFWEHLTPPSASIPGAGSINFSMDDISMYNGTMGIPAANDPGASTTPNGVISTGQGFGIKAFGAGTVTFNNTMRLTTGNNTLRIPDGVERLTLKVSNAQYELGSYTGIGFREGATPGLDDKYDSNRLATFISLYSHLPDGSEQLGIQTREAFESGIKIPMGFSSQVEAETIYTISIANVEGDNLNAAAIYLIDNQEQTITDLTLEDHQFMSDKGVFDERFTLQFEYEVLDVASQALDAISVYPNPTSDLLNIVSPQLAIDEVIVYDVQGRQVQSQVINGDTAVQMNLSLLDSALYFVRIETESGSITKRIIRE